ncbi:MAG: MoaD/ThiS family protein [Chloroflexi bacterium]|nr:MoaD/ThiS family protein [Chloroflexota bacterium]
MGRASTERISVKVSFLGELRSIARRREIEVTLARGSSLSAVLAYLCENLGEGFAREVLDQDGHLRPHLSIFVNNRSIEQAQGLATRLDGGEVDLLLLPALEGG